MSILSKLACVCLPAVLFALGSPTRLAAADPREVLVVWDMTRPESTRLTITVTESTKTRTIASPDAYNFRFKPDDRVLATLRWAGAMDGAITSAVTGTNLDAKDLEALKKLVTGSAPLASPLTGKGLAGDMVQSLTRAVTDDLIAGGRLTFVFALKLREGATRTDEVGDYGSGSIIFRIESRSPRFTVSNGVGITRAPDPVVTIAKTATIIAFQKDDKPQQAYEQVIAVERDEEKLRPIQTALVFANFNLGWRLYATLGVQLNQKVFEEPVLGFTYRHPLTGSMGLNLLAAAHFSNETRIKEESGFEDGMKLDPTVGLTVGDIPTEKSHEPRFLFGLSVDF
jgi:hypothetical protein